MKKARIVLLMVLAMSPVMIFAGRRNIDVERQQDLKGGTGGSAGKVADAKDRYIGPGAKVKWVKVGIEVSKVPEIIGGEKFDPVGNSSDYPEKIVESITEKNLVQYMYYFLLHYMQGEHFHASTNSEDFKEGKVDESMKGKNIDSLDDMREKVMDMKFKDGTPEANAIKQFALFCKEQNIQSRFRVAGIISKKKKRAFLRLYVANDAVDAEEMDRWGVVKGTFPLGSQNVVYGMLTDRNGNGFSTFGDSKKKMSKFLSDRDEFEDTAAIIPNLFEMYKFLEHFGEKAIFTLAESGAAMVSTMDTWENLAKNLKEKLTEEGLLDPTGLYYKAARDVLKLLAVELKLHEKLKLKGSIQKFLLGVADFGVIVPKVMAVDGTGATRIVYLTSYKGVPFNHAKFGNNYHEELVKDLTEGLDPTNLLGRVCTAIALVKEKGIREKSSLTKPDQDDDHYEFLVESDKVVTAMPDGSLKTRAKGKMQDLLNGYKIIKKDGNGKDLGTGNYKSLRSMLKNSFGKADKEKQAKYDEIAAKYK